MKAFLIQLWKNMNKYKILKDEFNITDKSIEKLIEWEKIFIEYNSHTNLMSRNDVDYIFEKHVYDSLAILKWEDFYKFNNILDVGCGGGFPSVILAICFENKNIIANDSRIKKINFILKIKDELKLNNLTPLYNRIEQAQPQNADLILSYQGQCQAL